MSIRFRQGFGGRVASLSVDKSKRGKRGKKGKMGNGKLIFV